ncbi:(2Fe-2S)-binding protein, partial [uncultured Methylobacterium sp.]|uniref:(2Fe-2S)-binding protein n=1 Tax=uncultured Methylobacterium sp. TaxID=157278 RepID=UPI0035CC070B
MSAGPVRYRLNGREHALAGPPRRPLLDLLRETHGLMAAKPGCGIGRCGACLVLLDGRPVNACLVMSYRLDGVEIISPEGLDALPESAPVRAALIAENAFQCGYCAPGVTVCLVALLRREPDADEAAIRAALAGNLCRCTGYASILRG